MTTKLTNVAVSPFLDGNTRGCAAKPKAVPPAAVPDYPSVFSLPPLTVRNLRIVLSPAPHPIHTVRRIGATAVGGFLLLFAALTLPSPACSLPDDSPYATPPVVREPLRWSTPRSPTNWPPPSGQWPRTPQPPSKPPVSPQLPAKLPTPSGAARSTKQRFSPRSRASPGGLWWRCVGRWPSCVGSRPDRAWTGSS
jgi:hypothetical protein